MITNIFLLFVAFGISIASILSGFGGIFPILVALSAVAVAIRLLSRGAVDSEHDPARV